MMGYGETTFEFIQPETRDLGGSALNFLLGVRQKRCVVKRKP